MLDDSTGGIKGLSGFFRGNGHLYKGLMLGILLFVFLGATGCESVKPLTPEEQSLVSAWSIREKIERAFAEKSVAKVLENLSPSITSDPKTQVEVSDLFAMFESVNLHLTMDSGRIDETSHTIHFRAHWTMTGVPKGKTGRRYFQTGECRLVVSVGKAPVPARIRKIMGDTFLVPPGKTSPNT